MAEENQEGKMKKLKQELLDEIWKEIHKTKGIKTIDTHGLKYVRLVDTVAKIATQKTREKIFSEILPEAKHYNRGDLRREEDFRIITAYKDGWNECRDEMSKKIKEAKK